MPTVSYGPALPISNNDKYPGNSATGRSHSRWAWAAWARDTTLAEKLRKLYEVCTTTSEGSPSETFRLSGTDSSDDGAPSTVGMAKPVVTDDAEDFVDAVVIDNDMPSLHKEGNKSASEGGGSQSQQTGSGTGGYGNPKLDIGDEASYYQGGFRSWLRWRAWPAVYSFFEPRMPDEKTEKDYQNQYWHSVKALTFVASLYLVLNWVLYLILNRRSTKRSTYAQIVYYGPLTFFTVPLPFMIAFDMPRKRVVFFQIFFVLAVWWCAVAEVAEIKVCRFYLAQKLNEATNQCNGKDFLAMNYYSTGLPAMMMFIISRRLYNAVLQLVFFVLINALIIPDEDIYARNVISFLVFSLFIQWISFVIERSQRHMFLLALQLKAAYKAKHKAQIAENKAGFTKRRFANYVFHEVRVPLNNAWLAFQLLQSGNAFRDGTMHRTEIHALECGLDLMKTVLNDVLDFEKMDAGHFENVPRPFPIHRSITTILDLIGVQTESRHISLVRNLDPRIDHLGLDNQEEGLWVVGSELRLQQVITNLATNAVKYTPEGAGPVTITTHFLDKTPEDDDGQPVEPPDTDDMGNMVEEDVKGKKEVAREVLTLRIEIHDSGPGIKPSDLVENRLFQPFIQTSVGKLSGSGTGLGLAIVKQIVKMSGGRLGVTSKRGQGAKFWVELSYPIATREEVAKTRQINVLAPVSATLVTSELPDPFNRPRSDGTSPPPLTAPAPPYENPQKYNPASMGTIRVTHRPTLPDSGPSLLSTTSSELADPFSVLVVDDDPMTRTLLSKLLSKLGCVVDTAENGQECLEMLLGPPSRTYDLICLDNFMPHMTGEEAVRELRENKRDDYVVGCTGNALTEDQNSYREAGADEVLTKPLHMKDLKQVLEVVRLRREQRRANALRTLTLPPDPPAPP